MAVAGLGWGRGDCDGMLNLDQTGHIMVGDATLEGRWGKDVADLECLTTAMGTYRSLKM